MSSGRGGSKTTVVVFAHRAKCNPDYTPSGKKKKNYSNE